MMNGLVPGAIDVLIGIISIGLWEAIRKFIRYSASSWIAALEGKRHRKELGGLDNQQFSYDGVRCEIFVVDVARKGYRDENIQISVGSRYVSVKERLDELSLNSNEMDSPILLLRPGFEESHKNWKDLKGKAGHVVYDNIELLGVDNVDIDRTGPEEENVVRWNCTTSSYIDHRAITSCYQSATTETKRKLLQAYNHGNSCLGRLSAISSAVVTHDGYMLFERRGLDLTSDPGKLTCGVNEGMKTSDRAQGVPSVPKLATIRGFHEEFGVLLSPAQYGCVTIFSTVLNRDSFEWYFLGIIDLRGMGTEYARREIEQKWRIGAVKDKFESDSIISIPFNKHDVFTYIKANQTGMTEYGVALAMMSVLFFEKKASK